jgi:Arc/MetJ-type ribon-helix-helix transcriptional regulator
MKMIDISAYITKESKEIMDILIKKEYYNSRASILRNAIRIELKNQFKNIKFKDVQQFKEIKHFFETSEGKQSMNLKIPIQ